MVSAITDGTVLRVNENGSNGVLGLGLVVEGGGLYGCVSQFAFIIVVVHDEGLC